MNPCSSHLSGLTDSLHFPALFADRCTHVLVLIDDIETKIDAHKLCGNPLQLSSLGQEWRGPRMTFEVMG